MDNPSSQQLKQVHEKDREHLVRVLKLLSTAGFKILDNHKRYFYHHRRSPKTSQAGSPEAKADSQDKSSLSISGVCRNKCVNILRTYVYQTDRHRQTPLYLAAGTGDKELVDIFLKAGADVNTENKYKQTSLYVSAKRGYKEVVETLLEAGANVSAEDACTQTPLHVSAENGHTEVVEMLVKAGANVEAQDKRKQTPLHSSARCGQEEVVKILLKAGASVHSEDEHKQNPLHLCIVYGIDELIKTLLKAGANGNAEDKAKISPLHYVIGLHCRGMVQVLLESGANVDAENKDKQTPLHLCATFERTLVNALLKSVADADAGEMCKQIQLHTSVVSEMDDVAKALICAGASGTNKDIWGHSVLDYMDDRQRVRLGLKPRKKGRLHNKMCSVTRTKRFSQRSCSIKTRTEHTESSSTTFIDFNTWPYEEGHTYPFWDRTIPKEDTSSLTESEPLCCLSSPAELQDLEDIRQQVENHWAKFSPQRKEGCETSFSHSVEPAALFAGRIVIPTTINVTQNRITKKIKNIKHIYNYEPGTSLNIRHAENVAPGGQIIVHQIRNLSINEDDSSSEDDSFV